MIVEKGLAPPILLGDVAIRIEVDEGIGQRVDTRPPQFDLGAVDTFAALGFALGRGIPRPVILAADLPA